MKDDMPRGGAAPLVPVGCLKAPKKRKKVTYICMQRRRNNGPLRGSLPAVAFHVLRVLHTRQSSPLCERPTHAKMWHHTRATRISVYMPFISCRFLFSLLNPEGVIDLHAALALRVDVPIQPASDTPASALHRSSPCPGTPPPRHT